MARREVTMNEIVEVVYQWHQGAGFKAISRSLGLDRKTVRKYIRVAQLAGISRSSPFPEEMSLVSKLKDISSSSPSGRLPLRMFWRSTGSGWPRRSRPSTSRPNRCGAS